MKVAKFTLFGNEMWGVVNLDTETIQPIEGAMSDWAPRLTHGLGGLIEQGEPVPIVDVTLLPPLTPTSTIIGVGVNYQDHVAEMRGEGHAPKTTVGFMKPRVSMIGAYDEIRYPTTTRQLDYEIELVAVVGVPLDERTPATEGLLGYAIGNDISARDSPSPLGGPDLFAMKGLKYSTPLGPWIVTPDELGGRDQPDLELICRVNGETRQNGRTSGMTWGVNELFDWVLARTDMTTGDVLFTGTCSGTGKATQNWLQPGDVVESEIPGIGALRNTIGARRDT